MQAARALTLRHSHCKSTVFTAISNNIGWRRSFAAVSVQSEFEEEPKKKKKRISKDERRSLVKAFVNKYRASNAGKFPSATEAQKRVGGGYYNVKKIIQELQYNSKHAATRTIEKDETLLEEFVPLPEFVLHPRSDEGADMTDSKHLGKTNETQTFVVDNMDIDESTSSDSQLKEETLRSFKVSSSEAASNSSEEKPETLSSIEISLSETAINSSQVKAETLTSIETSTAGCTRDIPNVVIPSNSDKTHTQKIKLENKEISHLCTEEPKNSKEAVDFDESNVAKENMEETTEPEKLELPKGIHLESVQNQSTVWGSLRSFADGIVNLWRKL